MATWSQGADSDAQVEVVEVSGSGIDVESAERDAYRAAVRKVVGAYVTTATRTENDELIEDKVISVNSGWVEKAETLKQSSADGLIKVRIRAAVRISKVIESLKSNNIAVANIDGQALHAELLTKRDQRKGEAELAATAFDGFPAKWFKVPNEVGKPRLGDRGDDGDTQVFVTVPIEADTEAFTPCIAKLEEALKASVRPHGAFEVDGGKCGFGRPAESRYSPEDASRALDYELCDGHQDSSIRAVIER